MEVVSADPKLLLIDMTSMLGPAATSTLKKAYFGDWRSDALLHVQAGAPGAIALAAGLDQPRKLRMDSDAARMLVEKFAPEVILYRPLADRPELHEFAMAVIEASDASLALWFMDDWPARLEAEDALRAADLNQQLATLFKRSRMNFAISDGMATAFGERYGVTFHVAHNGVRLDELPPRQPAEDGLVRVRYAGSLAPDTTKDSVLTAARAVSALASGGQDVVFEGRTQQIWLDQVGAEFNALKGVSLKPSNMTQQEYRQWLADADILLIAYNFDEKTRRYLQYSFANKTPETLSAGAAVIAFGPTELETLSFLRNSGVVESVDAPNEQAIRAAIQSLATDPKKRDAMAARARAFAIQHFDLERQRAMMRRALSDLSRATPLHEPTQDELARRFNNCVFARELITASTDKNTLIAVAPPNFEAIAAFAEADWDVQVTARSSVDREGLTSRSAQYANVRIETVEQDQSYIDQILALSSRQDGAPDVLLINLTDDAARLLDALKGQGVVPKAIVATADAAPADSGEAMMRGVADKLMRTGYQVFISAQTGSATDQMLPARHGLWRYPDFPDAGADLALIACVDDPNDETFAQAYAAASCDGAGNVGANASVEILTVANRPARMRSVYRKFADAVATRAPFVATVLRAPVRLLRKLLRPA